MILFNIYIHFKLIKIDEKEIINQLTDINNNAFNQIVYIYILYRI